MSFISFPLIMVVCSQRSHLSLWVYFVSMVKLYFKALKQSAESMLPLNSF